MDVDSEDPTHQKIRLSASISIVSAVALTLLYIVAVRTGLGRDIAFEGRSVEDPEVTRELNDLLHSVTRSTLVLLTAALVMFALARRRIRLAITVGHAVTISVLTTEISKSRVLSRPSLDEVAGIAQNSFPSGHATIGMSLSLGMMIAALILSLTFGIGVLATGGTGRVMSSRPISCARRYLPR